MVKEWDWWFFDKDDAGENDEDWQWQCWNDEDDDNDSGDHDCRDNDEDCGDDDEMMKIKKIQQMKTKRQQKKNVEKTRSSVTNHGSELQVVLSQRSLYNSRCRWLHIRWLLRPHPYIVLKERLTRGEWGSEHWWQSMPSTKRRPWHQRQRWRHAHSRRVRWWRRWRCRHSRDMGNSRRQHIRLNGKSNGSWLVKWHMIRWQPRRWRWRLYTSNLEKKVFSIKVSLS